MLDGIEEPVFPVGVVASGTFAWENFRKTPPVLSVRLRPKARLSMRRQCGLLSLSRSTAYYEPVPTPAEDLTRMRLIDELAALRETR